MNDEMYEEFKVRYDLLQDLSNQYWNDAALRDRIDGGDSLLVQEKLDFSVASGVEVQVSANTGDVYHVIMPSDPNYALSDQALEQVTAGARAGSASSIGSAGSVATSTGASTLSSIGTAGSADPGPA